jgi:hypothetical protein
MHPRTQSRSHWQRLKFPGPQGAPKSLIERMVDDLIDLQAEGDATRPRMLERGFTRDELDAHEEEARRRADLRFVRREDSCLGARTLAEAERLAGDAIAELLPPKQIVVAELQARRFTTREIEHILDRAMARAALAFCGRAVEVQ